MESDRKVDYLHHYREGVGALKEKFPQIMDAYHHFTGLCFEEGALSVKEKHLIALGTSIASQDDYCMIYHTEGSLHAGASEDEVLEAVAVAGALGGGTAMSQGVTTVQDTLAEWHHVQH